MQNGGIAEDCSVLVVGDIYDTYNPSAVAEELFYDVIDRLNDIGKRAVVVIIGNPTTIPSTSVLPVH